MDYTKNPLLAEALKNNPDIAGQLNKYNTIQPAKMPTVVEGINAQIKNTLNSAANPLALLIEWVNVFTLHEHGDLTQNKNFSNFLYTIQMQSLVKNGQLQGMFYEEAFAPYSPNYTPPQTPQTWVKVKPDEVQAAKEPEPVENSNNINKPKGGK